MEMAFSIEQCYRRADEMKDAAQAQRDEQKALDASLLWQAAWTAEFYRRKLRVLAWAVVEKNKAKRNNTLAIVRAEIEGNDGSAADFPFP